MSLHKRRLYPTEPTTAGNALRKCETTIRKLLKIARENVTVLREEKSLQNASQNCKSRGPRSGGRPYHRNCRQWVRSLAQWLSTIGVSSTVEAINDGPTQLRTEATDNGHGIRVWWSPTTGLLLGAEANDIGLGGHRRRVRCCVRRLPTTDVLSVEGSDLGCEGCQG